MGDARRLIDSPIVKAVPKVARAKVGAVIVDALAAVFVFAVAAVGVYSLIPVVSKSSRMGRDETLAVQMVTRLIEHMQLLPARDVTPDKLRSLNLIDADDDTSPYSFARIPLDEASRYSPAQALRNARAEIWIEDAAANSKIVRVELAYQTANGRTETIRTGTVVGGYR